MSKQLDTIVSEGLYQARLLEDALHAVEPWSMRWCDQERFVERRVENDGVTFVATFDAVDEPESIVELRHNGEIKAVRMIPALLGLRDRTKPVVLTWSVALQIESVVSE